MPRKIQKTKVGGRKGDEKRKSKKNMKDEKRGNMNEERKDMLVTQMTRGIRETRVRDDTILTEFFFVKLYVTLNPRDLDA